MAKRARYLFVCLNRRPDGNPKGSCANGGSELVYDALKQELHRRGMTKTDVRACSSSCLDLCALGPAIAVEPDHYFYRGVTVADVPAIIDALQKGERVERLVVTDDEFTDSR